MRRLFIAICLPALVATAVIPVAAHHTAAAYYDATRPVSMSGAIVELRANNPHAVLIIDGTAPDGRTGRWAFEGIPPNAFQYRGQKDYKERLKPGTTITISGWPAKDAQARAFSANTITFTDGSTMIFGSTTLEEGHGSGCTSPCPGTYTYPTVE